MAGAFQVSINSIDVSNVVKKDTLQELTISAEGRLMWEFVTDTLNFDANRRIFTLLGLTMGDSESINKMPVEVFVLNERKFAGWVNVAEWDEKSVTVSLECDSVGIVVKDFLAGYLHFVEVNDGIFTTTERRVLPFQSTYFDSLENNGWIVTPPDPEGPRILVSRFHDMTVQTYLDKLSLNINVWLDDNGYSRFTLAAADVSVRDFVQNYIIGNGEEFDAEDSRVLSIRYESITGQYYLITREVDSTGDWAYYRTLINGSGTDSAREFMGYYIPSRPPYILSASPASFPFTVTRASDNVIVGRYELTSAVSPDLAPLPDAVKEYLVSKFEVQEGDFIGFVQKGSFWFTIGIYSGGDRSFFEAQILQEDKYQFLYEEDSLVAEALSDIAKVSDALVGFDYSGSGDQVNIYARNRVSGAEVTTRSLVDIKRKSSRPTNQEFTVPSAFTMLPAVKTEIKEFYVGILNRASQDNDTLVRNRNIDDISLLLPGKRLRDASDGDLGQINSITYRETSTVINCRKRADS